MGSYNTTQRIAALYCFLADAPGPVDAETIRLKVNGYTPDESDAAFDRKFRRDRNELGALGVHVVEDHGSYRLDRTFRTRGPVHLDAQEAATLRACAASALGSSSFILHAELLRALNKLADDPMGHISDIEELPPLDREDREPTASVYRACQNAKTLVFAYTNRRGESRTRTVDPYVLRSVGSDWYLDGLDHDETGQPKVKTFRLSRMGDIRLLEPNRTAPDFTVPAGFTPERTAFAFDIGEADVEVTLFLDESILWKGDLLTRGRGTLENAPGGLLWHLHVADEERFLEWLAANSPGVTLLAPASLVARWDEALRTLATIGGER